MNNDYENEQQAPQTDPNSPYGAPVPPYAPYYNPAPEKVRRVGTLTMGLALIATGIAAIISMFFPHFDFALYAKLAPLILVFLGVEILLNHFFGRGVKLKYDFLSGFVCFLVICGSVCALTIPPLYQQFGHRYADSNRIERELEDQCFTTLQGLPIASLDSEVSLNGIIDGGAGTLTSQTLRPSDYVRLNITLLGTFADKAQFAQGCKTVLDKVNTLGVAFDRVEFYSIQISDGNTYQLEISDRFSAALPVDKLTSLVDDNSVEKERERMESEWEAEQSRIESEREAEQSRTESEREAEQSRIDSEREAEQSRAESERETEQSRINSEREELQREREALSSERDALSHNSIAY